MLHDKASSPPQTVVRSKQRFRLTWKGLLTTARKVVVVPGIGWGRDVVGWDTEPGKDGTIRATTPSVSLTKAKTNKQK